MSKEIALLFAASLSGYAALGGELRVESNSLSGVTASGAATTFTVHYSGTPARERAIRVRLFRNGLEVQKQNHPLNPAIALKVFCAEAEWLAVTAELIDEKGIPVGEKKLDPEAGCGVLAAPEKIHRSRPRPADFERFWQQKKAELAQIPMSVRRTPVPLDEKEDALRCDEVQIAAWHDIPVSGYLMMPRNPEPHSLPAVVYFHGAGLRSALKRPEFADRAIVLDVNAHGMPNGKENSYYRNLMQQEKYDRVFRNRSDRDNAYLNGLFLRVVRSLDFVRSLPEWNGKDLIVFGRSQGGAQAIVAAALVPEVTLCIANVPALCDHGGYNCGRLPGWPRLNQTDKETPNAEKLAAVSDYFDIVNFASMIRCPVRMTAGLIDFTCPPTSVLAAYGEIPPQVRRSIQYFPTLGHAAPPAESDGRELVRKEIEK